MTLRLLVTCILLFATTQANAQLVTYQFTGSQLDGTLEIGSEITGELTLDLDAVPTSCSSDGYSPTDFCVWEGGAFSIDATTSGGVIAGTGLGGETAFAHRDLPEFSSAESVSTISNDDLYCQISLVSLNLTSGMDGDGSSIPDPWDPIAEPIQQIYVERYNRATDEQQWGIYSIDTFTSDRDGDGIPDSEDACLNSDMSPTVVIQGIDTGVENFLDGDGCTIADLIAQCASAAKNHGQFVRCVSHLTNSLKADGVISGKEKGSLQRAAAEAAIP